jgi:hypothetical protein
MTPLLVSLNSMYVCMHVHMHACMCVCMCVHACVYACVCVLGSLKLEVKQKKRGRNQ